MHRSESRPRAFSFATASTAALFASLLLPPAASAQCRVTTRETLTPSGGETDDESVFPMITEDGRYFFFGSTATNLLPGVGDGLTVQIFRRDRTTGSTHLVSASSSGVPGNEPSFSPITFSRDGRYVVFYTDATNFGYVDNNNTHDVYLHDCDLGTTTLISESLSGTTGNFESWKHAITPDARFIVFMSKASNLVPGDINARSDAFLLDRTTGVLEIVSLNSAGMQCTEPAQAPEASDDGRFVVFDSRAPNLVPGDTNASHDIFVRDRQAGTTTRISEGPGGVQGNDSCSAATISGDGRYIAYNGHATNLVPGDVNGQIDVFWHDRATGETRIVSRHSDGTLGNAESTAALLSDSGRFVGFTSYATNLVDGDTTGGIDVFRHDLLTGVTIRINVSSSGEQDNLAGGPQGAFGSGMSDDGRTMTFNSFGTNLVPGDTNGTQDGFLHEINSGPVGYCVATPNSTGAEARITADGIPSVADCSLRLLATPVPNQPGLFYMGQNQVQLPFGNGFRCIGAPAHRFLVQAAADQTLARMLDTTSPPANLITAGSTWNFQAWFRDPAAGGAQFNLSDAVTQTFCP